MSFVCSRRAASTLRPRERTHSSVRELRMCHMRFRLFFRLDIRSRSEYSFFRNIFAVRDAESAKEAARARRLRPGRAQPRAMKFGHRFQQVIEQTHPSVSDQVRSRAARHPSGMAGDKKLVTRRSSARHGARAVRAARRSRPSRVSRRARARARCRAATRSGASRRDTRPSAARLAAPYPPILVADQGKPPEPNASNPRTVESSRARFNVPFGRVLTSSSSSRRSSCATKP